MSKPTSDLRDRALKGLAKHFPLAAPDLHYRLDYELSVIDSIRGAPYLLFLVEVVRSASALNIRCWGTGPANASLVCYCIGITSIDPVRYGLFFEGFIIPDQRCLPEIRFEFGESGRSIMCEEKTVLLKILQKFRPASFDDLCVLVALRHAMLAKQAEKYFRVIKDRRKPTCSCQVLGTVLDETAGVLVYEEQAFRIMQTIGGLTLSQAFEFRNNVKLGQECAEAERWRTVCQVNAGKRGFLEKDARAIFMKTFEFLPFLESKTAAVEIALAFCQDSSKILHPGKMNFRG
jgi:DNA polymerase III alpha subunit